MEEKNNLTIGDRIRDKKTGKEMEVVELSKIYDVDKKKYFRNNKVVYSTFEVGKDCNTIGEINISDIERID